MTLKRIELSMADRQLMNRLLGSLDEVPTGITRDVREIRRRFELRKAGKLIDKLTERLREYGEGISWDDLMDCSELVEEFQKRLDETDAEDKQERERLEKLLTTLSMLGRLESYTIDDAHLTWLRDQMTKKVWSKAKATDSRTGQTVEVEVPVPPDQMEAIADLLDKLGDAIAAAGVRAEKSDATKAGEGK